ncbi:MAG: sigma-54-dependent Fis family transcriptional regulator [Deltaproteobacteria bacterium]|jgi:two-component system response regulator AtoC|nr:sigma-54-dependent Fis family transcriptional regulator [Deltaproteobacteria bacterium]
MARILLAEDDEIMRITIQDRLKKNKWHVEAVPNGKEASERLKKGNYHLVISDIRMPGFDGWQLLKFVRQSAPNTDIIMMTAFGSVDDAIESLKKGAADYILKPFNMDDLIIRVSRILEMQTIKARCTSLEESCREMHPDMIGKSKALAHILGLIKQVAPTDSTVLILGESGTGKELVASSIHQQSKRASKPFVRINCAAIPEGLMESELFGHEKGAFTGAHVKKLGKFEMADGGSMLLDEIGEMPLALQAKLLRVLEESMYERVGGTGTIKVDVRILCATSKDLEQAVDGGSFRKDLYYRLNVIPIHLPPLRERKEDIPVLTEHFLHEFSINRGMKMEISPEAMQCLIDYNYPGNVRELKNIIERASVLAPEQVIKPHDLPADLSVAKEHAGEGDTFSLSQTMAKTEKQLILKVLAQTNGKKGEAADLLGISRKNLWEKMKLYNISAGS